MDTLCIGKMHGKSFVNAMSVLILTLVKVKKKVYAIVPHKK